MALFAVPRKGSHPGAQSRDFSLFWGRALLHQAPLRYPVSSHSRGGSQLGCWDPALGCVWGGALLGGGVVPRRPLRAQRAVMDIPKRIQQGRPSSELMVSAALSLIHHHLGMATRALPPFLSSRNSHGTLPPTLFLACDDSGLSLHF